MQLNENTIALQELLATVNELPSGVNTDDATAEGNDLLQGKTAYANGQKIVGTIPVNSQENITVSGPNVIVPAGYYASDSNKLIQTAGRANTTISVSGNDANDTLTITASNNQSTGYVVGADKTATKTITLTTSDNMVTASDGTVSISKSVATTSRANTTISVTADDTNDKLTITASNNQATGYVTGANKTATKTITLTASGATVTASDGSKSISKSVATATQATPGIEVNADGLIMASAAQAAGYVSAGTKTATKQLPIYATKTITPTAQAQLVVPAGYYTTGDIMVDAISMQQASLLFTDGEEVRF